MAKLILVLLLMLVSLLNLFRAPLNILWYVSILTTEFCWIFILALCALLLIGGMHGRFSVLTSFAGVIALICFALPIVQAYRISGNLGEQLGSAFGSSGHTGQSPFQLRRMIGGIGAEQLTPRSITFSEADSLTLDWYAASSPGNHPCVIVIHGGSWAGGNKKQLPELNTYLAARGYQVASINYRLAPTHQYPAPIEDVKKAIMYLKAHTDNLQLDPSRFVLLGRSAGGQIALDAAYSLNDPSIKGVISYYGPTDMVWGYANPANPLVLDSKKIMEDYLGGTYMEVSANYVKSSATRSVTSRSVPTLLIQGRNDPLVAYDHCNRLDTQLVKLGVKHFVLRLPWATHGCDYTLNGPAGQLCTYTTTRFLASVTGNTP